MKNMTFSDALREQFRAPEAYLEQLGNVLFGALRVLGRWAAITATFTSGATILAFITADLNAYSQSDLQKGLQVVVTIVGGVAAIACVLGNIGKFRDVFSARATDKVQRYEAIGKEVQSQIDTTEYLLVKHGLITEADVQRRRADAEHRSATVSSS